MSAVAALVRADWQGAKTYRVQFLFSVFGLLAQVVPLYYVATALQPTMAEAIRGEGTQFFGFALLGQVAFTFVPLAVGGLASTIGASARNGTLEALLGTPVRFPVLLLGLSGYGVLWTAVRGLVMLAAGATLGAAISWSQMPAALLVLALIILSYIPIGLLLGAMSLAFRTTGPIPQAVLAVSALFGGVYYPTHVIPSWLEQLSAFVPLAYGLRAVRRVLLDGASLTAVLPDLIVLVGLTVPLFALGVWGLSAAMRYARRTGTLSLY